MGAHITETILGDGLVLPGASVTIIDLSTGLNANLFSDQALSIPVANPIIADAQGNIDCYAAAGNYRLTASATGYMDNSVTMYAANLPLQPRPSRNVVADFVLDLVNDGIVLADATAGNISGNIPSATTAQVGFEYTVKKVDSSDNIVYLLFPDQDTIELTIQGESITFVSNGTIWERI